MSKDLITGSYTSEGAKGVVAKGGSDRRAAVEKLAESVGGSVDTFYFVFGGDDIVLIIDAPDNESVAAVTMTVGASGLLDVRTTVLLTRRSTAPRRSPCRPAVQASNRSARPKRCRRATDHALSGRWTPTVGSPPRLSPQYE